MIKSPLASWHPIGCASKKLVAKSCNNYMETRSISSPNHPSAKPPSSAQAFLVLWPLEPLAPMPCKSRRPQKTLVKPNLWGLGLWCQIVLVFFWLNYTVAIWQRSKIVNDGFLTGDPIILSKCAAFWLSDSETSHRLVVNPSYLGAAAWPGTRFQLPHFAPDDWGTCGLIHCFTGSALWVGDLTNTRPASTYIWLFKIQFGWMRSQISLVKPPFLATKSMVVGKSMRLLSLIRTFPMLAFGNKIRYPW